MAGYEMIIFLFLTNMFVCWLVTIYFSRQQWLEILTIGIPMQMLWPRYVIYAFALWSIGSNDLYFLLHSNGIIYTCWNCLLSFQMIGKGHRGFVSLSSPVLFTATVFYLLIFFSDSVNINTYLTHLIDGKKRNLYIGLLYYGFCLSIPSHAFLMFLYWSFFLLQ